MNNTHTKPNAYGNIWKAIRWILGIFFIMGALGGFLQEEIWQASITLLIGLVILPVKFFAKRKEEPLSPSNAAIKSMNISCKEEVQTQHISFAQPKQPHKNQEEVSRVLQSIVQENQKRISQVLRSVIDNKESFPQAISLNESVLLPTTTLPEDTADESIIDITGQEQKLPSPEPDTSLNSSAVVPWPHMYIYSYDELYGASLKQRAFYGEFKSAFHRKAYLDLEGYNNYAFILLFDLLRSYDTATHETAKLEAERALQILGEQYPKTYSYAKSFLIERQSTNKDSAATHKISDTPYLYQSTTSYEYDWGIGKQYAKMLSLSKEQIALLNSINYSKGNFGVIDACFIEVLKLFNLVVAELNARATAENTSLAEIIANLTDIAARKNQRFTKGSDNYRWFTDYHKNNLYEHIMKHCDNAVRELYQYTRTKNVQCTYTNKETIAAFTSKLDAPVIAAVQLLKTTIKPPDECTEIELNALSTTRWKNRFDAIISGLTKVNTLDCHKQIEHLAMLNKKNSSVENIYYEAAKAFAPVARESAVAFYLKYVSADMKSARINAKPLTKTALKNHFKNPTEEAEFEQIIATLRTADDLEDALQKAETIFEKKRKKIQLDTQAVAQVKNQHSGTVDILNEVLNDEDELPVHSFTPAPVKVPLEATPEADTQPVAQPGSGLKLDAVQQELVAMFAANEFLLSEDLLTAFAKTKSLFKSRLIDSLNEDCYELLDDVLIEECEDGYQLNPDYYHKITA